MNAEMKLIKHVPLGDHDMFVGEAIEISIDENLKPLSYNMGKYWKVGDNIQKPSQEVLDKINRLYEKYRKETNEVVQTKK